MKNCMCIVILFFTGLVMAAAQENVSVETVSFLDQKADVYRPARMTGKIPAVFLAHNGYGKKEDRGTYPKELAGNGYVIVSIGWTDMNTAADVAKAIEVILGQYGANIDTAKVAFVGGCHGAVKLFTLLDNKDLMSKISVKTGVAISISEENGAMLHAVKNSPIPILAIYAKADQYGYSAINKKVAEVLLREPKKVVALDASPHGNEMLVAAKTKPVVAKEISDWLKKYLN